jgi:hypothetical protein
VRGDKDHPAETDYDVIHDEESRHNQEQAAEQFLEKRKKSLADLPQKPKKPAEEEPREEKVSHDGKGSRLDVEA